MTKSGFGDHLKREREMRAVSLDEICAATRISVRFLGALENEDWDKLPGGVFNRGFVRAVARFLGLDEEGFVAEYALAIQDRNPSQAWTSQAPPRKTAPRWIPWVGAAAAVLLLLLFGWFGWHRYALHRAQRNAARAASYSARPLAPSSPDGTRLSAPPPSAPGAPPAAGPATAGDIQLKIEAGKGTSLEVSADGKPAFAGPIIAGQNRTFSAHDTFTVAAQDGGALLLQLNGRTLAPIGPPGQPGSVMLTRRDVSTGAGGPD